MNKKNNRKGFTIVELVIVIAVIAILATVLIPTFGNVISKANANKLLQQIRNEFTEYAIENAGGVGYTGIVFVEIEGDYYLVDNGNITTDDDGAPVSYTDTSAAEAIEAGVQVPVWVAENDEIADDPITGVAAATPDDDDETPEG